MFKFDILEGTATQNSDVYGFRIDSVPAHFHFAASIARGHVNVVSGEKITAIGKKTDEGFSCVSFHNHDANTTFGKPPRWAWLIVLIGLFFGIPLSLIIVGLFMLLPALLLGYFLLRAEKAYNTLKMEVSHSH